MSDTSTFRGIRMAEVDPGLRKVARVMPRGFSLRRGLALPRAMMRLLAITSEVPGVQVASVNANVSVRLHRPAGLAEPAPALLWIHGGGYTMGSPRQDDLFCRRLAHLAHVAVVAVKYRLAPEFPYPAALEDCYAALTWTADQSWVDESRVAVGGASAGGGLAAALTLLARDRGEVELVYQLLTYPALDDRTGANRDGRRHVWWSAEDNQRSWQWYLGSADRAVAVPARRADLKGVPPAWIGVGTLDLFHDECLAYGRALRAAGVPCHDEIAVGAFHSFDQSAPNAPISLSFFACQCDHLRRALAER